MKIAVAGVGYVGLSLAALLAQNHEVDAVTTTARKADMINSGSSPIADRELEALLASGTLKLRATTEKKAAYSDAQFVIVATPTNYDPERDYFDTSSVEDVIQIVTEINPDAYIVIKSTVPVGYTNSICEKFETNRILFSPEFLREGRALYDNLYPSRIIVGADLNCPEMCQAAERFAELLKQGACKDNVETRIMGMQEAEAVKLFANTYLALRVAFFNELDTYSEMRNLNTKEIIEGICMDPRIGSHYNNPSFGYGGYCLPKDTRQLLANFRGVPENLIQAIVSSNDTRKHYVSDRICDLAKERSGEHTPIIGIYRLAMKANSDNARQSAVQDIIYDLCSRDVRVLIYEPVLGSAVLPEEVEWIESEAQFFEMCDLIVANRFEDCLTPVKHKVYSRDLFRRD